MVLLRLLVGEVTTVLSSTHTTIVETDNNVVITASTDISDAADGVILYSCLDDNATTFNGADTPTVDSASAGVCAGGGPGAIVGEISGTVTIRLDNSASETGITTWILYYIPISPGATVVAA